MIIKETKHITNQYIHEVETPALLLVMPVIDGKPANDKIFCGHFRKKHYIQDQNTFLQVMRLAMILDKYDSYSFAVNSTIDENPTSIQNVWAIGEVSYQKRTSAFYELDSNKQLIPYIEEIQFPIHGYIANLLPTSLERDMQNKLPQTVQKQVRAYLSNCSYKLKHNVILNTQKQVSLVKHSKELELEQDTDVMDVLANIFAG